MANYISVYEVFGISIAEQMELDTLTHAKLLRDAYVYKLNQTEDGKEYLEKCWRYQQVEPDRKALRKQFAK